MDPLPTMPYTNLRPITPTEAWLLRRLPRWAVAALVIVWTWPFLLTAFSLSFLALRPVAHVLVGGLLGAVVVIVLGIRSLHRFGVERQTGIRPESDLGRNVSIFVISIVIILAHAFALPTAVLFRCYRGSFETELRAAQQTLKPGEQFDGGVTIGPYRITTVTVGQKGSVLFHMWEEGGFQYTPAGVTGDSQISNDAASGPLGGGWEWTAQH